MCLKFAFLTKYLDVGCLFISCGVGCLDWGLMFGAFLLGFLIGFGFGLVYLFRGMLGVSMVLRLHTSLCVRFTYELLL